MTLTFDSLRSGNIQRQAEWVGGDQIDTSFRTIEIGGETGELMEAMKKYLRAQKGIGGTVTSLTDIADEMADVIIAIDLLAMDLKIDLNDAVAKKFNRTSDKYGLDTKL